MFHTPDYYNNISMRLSEVLDDIGVNEHMVMKRRKAKLLQETMTTIIINATGRQCTAYHLGSQTEGTTTPGLQSDDDILGCADDFTVIQDWSEWTPGKYNLLMIQDETTPPGYCLLQKLRDDAPLPLTAEDGNHFVKDTSGRILHKNTALDDCMTGEGQRQGPSLASAGQPGINARDLVLAFPCQTWPQSARAWLDQQETNTWPTVEMKRYMKTTPCFVVAVGSKASDNADFEWRLSTSLAERYLTFNLNITQIRCYTLMKMILKTYINVDSESYISSYMCKTVLFHCIASKPSHIWKEHNILNCLNFCLQTLAGCILSGNCPHFIVHENNLMAGKFSTEVKHQLLERMSNLTPCDGISIFGIQIDDLGERLQMKLNMINEVHHNVQLPDVYTMGISSVLSLNMAISTSDKHNLCYHLIGEESLETKLLQTLLQLTRIYRDGEMIEKTACRLLAPLHCTTIGSLIASRNILVNGTVSPQALAWLEAGQDSDVASSRLKLASVMYCAGDMERATSILNDVEERYNIQVTEPVCACYNFPRQYLKPGFMQVSSQSEAEAVIYIAAFCVRFSRSEINCVPHELQYEMFRSTQEDLLYRDDIDKRWMDCVVVDSLPYLYFLQYKTYGNLHRPREQQQALNKLMRAIEAEGNLGHRETALNLLGQCMEQENRPVDALQCYRLSLHLRERNNAANIHICRCLANTLS